MIHYNECFLPKSGAPAGGTIDWIRKVKGCEITTCVLPSITMLFLEQSETEAEKVPLLCFGYLFVHHAFKELDLS